MHQIVREFCKKYRSRIEPSQYRVNKIKNIDITFSDSEAIADPALDIEHEQMVAIHMPEAQFNALLEHDAWIQKHLGKSLGEIISDHEQECRVRNENPAVKAAYEQYLMLLNLSGHSRA